MTTSHRLIVTVFTVLLAATQRQLPAQFVSVFNTPPDDVPRYVRSDTQLNLFDGGVLESSYAGPFRVGRHADSNAELNIYGGKVGEQLEAGSGSRVNVYGGTVGRGFHATEGSEVTISGGRIADWFEAESGSNVTLSGGVVGRFRALAGSQVNLLGNAFSLNGQPVVADTVALTQGGVLSGVLQDGTPFVFSTETPDFLIGRDYIEEVTLIRTESPEVDLSPIVINSDDAPLGLSPGQTLTLEEGGVLPNNFTVIDATLHVHAGQVGNDMEVVGGEVNFGAGSIKGDFHAYHGTNVVFCGGVSYSGVFAYEGSNVRVVSGDILGGYVAGEGSSTTIAGGTIGGSFSAFPGSEVTFIGTEFSLDGQPIEGLANSGDTHLLKETEWNTLSGNFADGSPFSFVRATLPVYFYDGAAVNLELVPKYDCNADLVVDIADTACAVSSNINDVLAVADLIPGDVNGDGEVGFGDFTILSSNFGQGGGYQQGNLDRVGGIDFSDFLILSNHFGQTSGAVSSVPEPTGRCWGIIAIYMAVALAHHRRRQFLRG